MKISHDPIVVIVGLAPDGSHLLTLRSILTEANVDVRLLTPAVPSECAPESIAAMTAVHCPSLIVLELNEEASANSKLAWEFLRSFPTDNPVIVLFSDFNAEQIRTVLELGVDDFILPPFTAASVLPRVWRLLRSDVLTSSDSESLTEKLAGQRLGLVGESASFVEETNKLRQAARYDITVLISGETGTGKELVARAIHYLSQRSEHPFVPIDCGAIPPELTESELFGHERGAFTGAVARNRGLISTADHGTLFLDEVDALSLPVQAKLLRFLQGKEYRALGSSEIRKADVRVISATNRDLRQMVRNNEFREDLFYRLNVLQLCLPGLRHRLEDIAVLARHFAAKYAARFNKPLREFSRGALQRLIMHKWPGNVRELENVVETAVALGDGSVIRSKDLRLVPDQTESPSSFQQAKAQVITEFEREYISRILCASGGNVSEAARLAGKNRRALWELIRKHRIDIRGLRDSLAGVIVRKPAAGSEASVQASFKLASS